MKKLNTKGFSMVELLAAVAIMGVLATIAIVSVSTVLENADEKHYETQEKNMIMAAQSYAQDNRNILPKAIGDTRVITLEELQRSKYIGNVVDRGKKNCEQGSVTIFKYSKDGYSYRTHLVCPAKTIGNDPSESMDGPKVNLNVAGSYKDPYFTYSVEPRDANDDGKIISYSYKVYNKGVLVRDSGTVQVSKASSIDEKRVSLKEYVPGEFKVVFTASNHYGGTTTVTSGEKDFDDPDGPQCGEVRPKREEWQDVDEVTLTITCNDTSGSGCARELFTQHFTAESKSNIITISNNLGKKTNCVVDTYIDRTPPTKPTIVNQYENTWINKSYTLKITASDAVSGVAYYQYRFPNSAIASEKEWTTWETSKRTYDQSVSGNYVFTTPELTDERSEYIEVRSCDQANNCSDAAQSMIKIDKTTPSCTVTRNIASPNGTNSWYKTNVIVTLNTTDHKGSRATAKVSPLYYALTTGGEQYSNSAITTVLTKEQGNTSGVTWKGYIKDEAGNKASCTDASFKVDTTLPSCQINFSGTTGDNGWYKASNVSVSLTKSDGGGSTLASYGLTTSSSATYNSTTSNTQGNTTGTTWYGYVKDKAGNTANCSKSLKVDTVSPTCSLNKSGTWNSGGFYTSKVTVSFASKTDSGGSTLASYGLNTSNSATYNNSASKEQGASNGVTWYGFVKDAAGNTGSCNTGSFKVLLEPPKITFSLSGSTSTATCVDGNTGAFITSGTKTLSSSSLTHSFSCTNEAGQTSSKSKTYKATYHCTSTGTACDTCHGSNCGGCCGTGGSYCSYACNCTSYCSGGYYSYS